MLNVLMIANIVLSFTAFVLAVMQVNHLTPWAIGLATINAVTLFAVYVRRQHKLASPEYMNTILERARQFINDENGGVPPNGVKVNCDQCAVTETYPVTNDAARSPHLNTHPERCRVIGA
jgi:hypothetical protein